MGSAILHAIDRASSVEFSTLIVPCASINVYSTEQDTVCRLDIIDYCTMLGNLQDLLQSPCQFHQL